MDDVFYNLIFSLFSHEKDFHLNLPFFDILQYIAIIFLETTFIFFPHER